MSSVRINVSFIEHFNQSYSSMITDTVEKFLSPLLYVGGFETDLWYFIYLTSLNQDSLENKLLSLMNKLGN